jgi:hypothetical protein
MTRLLALLVVALLAGCTTDKLGRVGEEPRAAITYAATASYPGSPQPSDRISAAAVDDRGARELVIYNMSDTAVPRATVWVNGAFLHRVPGIAPRRSVEISYRELLEAGQGVRDLRTARQAVRRVELETSDGLFTVQGPALRR